MGLKRNLFYKIVTGILIGTVAFSPLSVHAAEEEVKASEMQAAYHKAIESNSWENWPTGPSVYAESAIVMEADTGMILYSKDIEAKRYPASITKILTALVVLENAELDEEVLYSYHATHSIEYGSSSIARTEGEILTVEESLYALLLASANECANALAEHISGSTEAFAVLMNEKAKELGCINTNFTNANGLHDENHYTCAYDMALITQAAIANEDFRRISGTDYYTLRATNKNPESLWMQNHHNMIAPFKTAKYLDETVFSGKTGYTSDALNTLVTCAARNGMDFIVVTMQSHSTSERGVPVFTDTAALLDYTGSFQKLTIADNEQTFVVGNAYDFSIDSEELNNTASLISIDESGSIILPNTASFTDADASIVLEDGSAYLTYEYAGQIVGKAPITLTIHEEEEFSISDIEFDESEYKTTFITINLKIIFMVLAVLAVIALIASFIYRFYRKNRAKIYKAVNIYKKRKLIKRKRQRRKRRR